MVLLEDKGASAPVCSLTILGEGKPGLVGNVAPAERY
jgi:hypothetical protein